MGFSLEHTHWKTSIHPRTHILVTLLQDGGRERDECQASRDGRTSIIACQPRLFSSPHSAPTSSRFFSASLISLCFEWWCWCVCGECSLATRTRRGQLPGVIILRCQLNLVSSTFVPPGHDKHHAF